MKFAVVFALALVALAEANLDLRAPWYEFKSVHGKVYRNQIEESLRYNIFQDNLEKIRKHNERYEAGLVSYKMGVNKFADMTHEEFKQYLALSGPVPEMESERVYQAPIGGALPATVDWRKKGAVNAVKDQGQCGSCWAFSTVGSLESINYLKTGKLQSYSEQNLVDCSSSYGNMGCNGGLMEAGYNYIKDNGLESEAAYPYTAADGTCKFNKAKSVITVSGHVNVAKNEAALQAAVANQGPIAVAVDASEWQFYTSGIFSTNDFNGLDHGVVVVGYGTENSQDYWTVRNSWGGSWGEAGYIRLARNKNNQCGITNMACYPTL